MIRSGVSTVVGVAEVNHFHYLSVRVVPGTHHAKAPSPPAMSCVLHHRTHLEHARDIHSEQLVGRANISCAKSNNGATSGQAGT